MADWLLVSLYTTYDRSDPLCSISSGRIHSDKVNSYRSGSTWMRLLGGVLDGPNIRSKSDDNPEFKDKSLIVHCTNINTYI